MKAKTQKNKSLVLPKEQVENVDLYKPVLEKKNDDHARIL